MAPFHPLLWSGVGLAPFACTSSIEGYNWVQNTKVQKYKVQRTKVQKYKQAG
jgi:hypothetical protein